MPGWANQKGALAVQSDNRATRRVHLTSWCSGILEPRPSRLDVHRVCERDVILRGNYLASLYRPRNNVAAQAGYSKSFP